VYPAYVLIMSVLSFSADDVAAWEKILVDDVKLKKLLYLQSDDTAENVETKTFSLHFVESGESDESGRPSVVADVLAKPKRKPVVEHGKTEESEESGETKTGSTINKQKEKKKKKQKQGDGAVEPGNLGEVGTPGNAKEIKTALTKEKNPKKPKERTRECKLSEVTVEMLPEFRDHVPNLEMLDYDYPDLSKITPWILTPHGGVVGNASKRYMLDLIVTAHTMRNKDFVMGYIPTVQEMSEQKKEDKRLERESKKRCNRREKSQKEEDACQISIREQAADDLLFVSEEAAFDRGFQLRDIDFRYGGSIYVHPRGQYVAIDGKLHIDSESSEFEFEGEFFRKNYDESVLPDAGEHEYGRDKKYPDSFFYEDPGREDFIDTLQLRKAERSARLSSDYFRLMKSKTKMLDIFMAYDGEENLKLFGLPYDFEEWWSEMVDLGPIHFLKIMTGPRLPREVFWKVWAHGMRIQFPEIIAGETDFQSVIGKGTKLPHYTHSRVMIMACNFLRADYYQCHSLDIIREEKYVVQGAQKRQANATQYCELCNSTHMFDNEVLWCDNCNSSWHEYHKFVSSHTYDGHKTTSAEDNLVEKNRRTWICPYCVNESFHGTQGQVVRRARDKLDDPELKSVKLWPGGREEPAGPVPTGGKGLMRGKRLMGWPHVI
jgi:hypothetical protein